MKDQTMSKEEVFSWIIEQGAVKAIVEFSGGGDEGGVENIYLEDDKGQRIKEFKEFYDHSAKYNWDTDKYESTHILTIDERVNQTLCKPVYDKYYSFAGDFHVNGTVVWDAVNKTCKMEGSKSHREYDDFEEDV